MSFLAASEIAAHPALPLLLGGLVTIFVRGRYAGVFMVAAPLLGLWTISLLEAGSSSVVSCFGQEIISVNVDKQSILFGYLFHLAAFIGGLYSFHLKDPWQISMGLLYAASAVGVAFAGDLLSLFLWWEALAVTSVFQIWGRKTERSEQAGFRYLFFHVLSGLLLLAGIAFRYASGDADPFALVSLTDLLTSGDAGAQLILLAIGVKCAFPFLHVWLTDGYPESTPTGAVFLSAFTTKAAICVLARLFPGAEVLITIGAVMAMFPIFYAVIENDLRRVLGYSMINQIGFMVVGIGIGTELSIDGSLAHAFNDVLFKGLLFMSMGAVLHRTGEIRGSELGGLYRTMPLTTGFCIVGAASISAFPLFSGFVSKSIIMAEAAAHGHHVVWLCLLFASAGVFHHAGIKIPFFAFFAHDSGLRPKEAPVNMLLAMGLAAFMCIFIGCNPDWLYAMLPCGAAGYHPYDATHVITQTEILVFSALAFTLLNLWKQYPPELKSINLDVDFLYRKGGRLFSSTMATFWNGLNEKAHAFFVGGIAGKFSAFTAEGPGIMAKLLSQPLQRLGFYPGKSDEETEADLEQQATTGIHPIGLTALFGILFLLGFLVLAWLVGQ
jgi:multicomponent Na+:H+ antiporter subunit D